MINNKIIPSFQWIKFPRVTGAACHSSLYAGTKGSSPFKGEDRRGMGVWWRFHLPHPHPNPSRAGVASPARFGGGERCSPKPRLNPLEGEGAMA
jgi:hypothetical protein